MSILRPNRLVGAAGWLIVLATIAPLTVDVLWWALLPAAVLLACGLLTRPTFAAEGPSRAGSVSLAGALVLALIVTMSGWIVEARLGIEPGWAVVTTTVVSSALVATTALLGLAIAVDGRPRIAGLLLAVAVPLGLGIDRAVSTLVPFGAFFLDGAGIFPGFILLAGALIRLARHDGASHQRTHRGAGSPSGVHVPAEHDHGERE